MAGVWGKGAEGAARRRSQILGWGGAGGRGMRFLLHQAKDWNCLPRTAGARGGFRRFEAERDGIRFKLQEDSLRHLWDGWMRQCGMGKTGQWLGNHQARQGRTHGAGAADTGVKEDTWQDSLRVRIAPEVVGSVRVPLGLLVRMGCVSEDGGPVCSKRLVCARHC